MQFSILQQPKKHLFGYFEYQTETTWAFVIFCSSRRENGVTEVFTGIKKLVGGIIAAQKGHCSEGLRL
jgi:hypothetical protein